MTRSRTLSKMLSPSRSMPSFWLCCFCLTSTLTTQRILALQCPASCRCFRILDSLQVDCSQHALTEYPDFESMPIEHLNLAGNNFVDFPTHLASIESLIYLDLSSNRISRLDATALQGFASLRTLILANNSITSWKSLQPSVAFRQAGNLKHLILSANKFRDTFSDATPERSLISESLIQLELRDCNISALSGDVLLNGLPQLDRLVLSDNALKSLLSLPSRSLRVLELSNSKLQRFSPFLLEGLPSLEVLNLSWNPGVQLDSTPGALLSSRSLNELDLSFCNLDAFDLRGLPNLTRVGVRGNMLRSVTSSAFVNNSLLETLDLAHNSLRLVDAASFGALKRLTKIDLSYNEIARLERNLFRANEVLLSVNLSHNVIEKLTKLVSHSMRELDVSWNEIVSMDESALSGLSSIQRLVLSNNLLREFPAALQSATLQKLHLSNCRLTSLRNSTFRGFPELASLWLNGNRFTTPFPSEYFGGNKYLDRIWLGDNPWICNCLDITFVDFHDYVTAAPEKVMDQGSSRCASPPVYYGRTWESACLSVWARNVPSQTAQRFWSTVLVSLVVIAGCFFLYTCVRKLARSREQRRNRNEYQRSQDEMQAIRRQNARMLQQEGAPNAPNPYENHNLPSYEDALLMPKPERPTKSMVDLRASSRASRRKLQRACTVAAEGDEGDEDIANSQPEEEELILDYCHRFRSEEMLSNRAKERMAPVAGFRRCAPRSEHHSSGSRCFGFEHTHFTASHLKSQNLQSAEKIANFQSYENSPYTKRRPKVVEEQPPFKRATLKADSVEFLTDPEYETPSKPNSPFARRRAKTPSSPSPFPSPSTPNSINFSLQQDHSIEVNPAAARLDPAIENYFGQTQSRLSNSTESSDFQVVVVVVESDAVASMPDDPKYSGSDEGTRAKVLQLGRRKKRRNSSSRRASGNFNAAAAAEATDSSASDQESKAMMHKPMRETLF